MFLAQADPEIVKIVEPAISTLSQSIIGAVLILSLATSILAVWKLLRVQEQAFARLEESNKRMEALSEKMITTFAKMENTLTNLTQAEKDGQTLLQALKNSQETIILEAVRGRAPRSAAGGGR